MAKARTKAQENTVATFAATILKFEKNAEKTGWTYIVVPADIAEQINPGVKKIFRIKGRLDKVPIQQVAILPAGDGSFILPLNAALRKQLAKKEGGMIEAGIAADNSPAPLDTDLMECLADAPEAKEYFQLLTPGHQRYFSNWVSDAKTEATKAKRIALCIDALTKRWDFGQMIRANKKT